MSRDQELSGRARELLFSRVASLLSAEPPEPPESPDATARASSTRAADATSKFTDFSTLPGYAEVRVQRAVGEKLKLANPYGRMHEGRLGPRTVIDGQELLDFSGYDYLGLNGHPEVVAAAKAAIDRYGISASGSRHVAGERPVHRALERAIAAHYQADAALTFVSGHATNVGVIGQIAGPKDLIISDATVHNSSVMGAVLSRAARRSFPHNDLDNLEQTLGKVRKKFERVLIVVEGLYGMDGDVPDLNRLVEIKKRYNAWLMVDEAHSLGVLGARGYGLFEQFDTDPRDVDIWMGTMSKTLVGCGGYIAGSAALIDYLRDSVGTFVYSVAMPPVIAASVETALAVMHREPERVSRLQANGEHFHRRATQLGLDSGSSGGFAVAPIIVGDSVNSVVLTHELAKAGVNVSPVFYPGVPMKSARLRFFLTSMHTPRDIDFALEALVAAMGELPGRLQVLKALL